ncbi:type III-A CRISPR-associated RAMP protein Csm3 [Caldicellulosiruptoraceae bacterium PP1]
MEDNEMILKKIIVLKTKMKLKSGLRIGGAKDEIKIGDIDNPIIRDPLTKVPYIPGSSIKGKMRSSLEIALKGSSKPCSCGICPICKLFGAGITDDDKNKEYKEVSRLIVRDSFMTDASQKLLLNFIGDYIEIKKENIVDRVKGSAEHPRTLDRIPAGAEFECEFILRIYQKDINEKKEKQYLSYINLALDLIKFTYLGGSGTRGYGKVEFTTLEEEVYEILDDGEFVKIEKKS